MSKICDIIQVCPGLKVIAEAQKLDYNRLTELVSDMGNKFKMRTWTGVEPDDGEDVAMNIGNKYCVEKFESCPVRQCYFKK